MAEPSRPRLVRFVPDGFTLSILATVAFASVLPVSLERAPVLETVTTVAIAVLFFFHGAKLSREAILSGLGALRLHLLVVLATFALFPLVGLCLRPLAARLLTPELGAGMLFLCTVPATVQSAIAFTSVARGNVPAAICSASASTLLGLLFTPLLCKLLFGAQAGFVLSGDRLGTICVQLLLPFVLGHASRRFLGALVAKHARIISLTDRTSILLVVYGAFSAAVRQGLWTRTPPRVLATLVVLLAALLAVVLVATTWGSRALGFSKEDEITIVFCGSKKSLASGVPLASVLFPGAAASAMVLPLMIFHQLQLMVCAVLAQRYARRSPPLEADV